MVNIFRQRIAVFYKDIEWVRGFMDAVYEALPRDSVSCYVKAKNDIRIEMMDESFIVALKVNHSCRGFRFDKIFFQSGIGMNDLDCLLVNRWGNYAPVMVNEDYEIVELPEAYSEYIKRWNVEDRSNKIIKTMTGYDYIEAVSDKQEVCNEINRLDRLRKILENRLEEEFKYS